MSDLILYHGGRTEPVCRAIPADQIDEQMKKAATLVKVPVSDADLSTVYRWGDGGLTPLSGPMDSATFNRVLDESVSGRFRSPCPLPKSSPRRSSPARKSRSSTAPAKPSPRSN